MTLLPSRRKTTRFGVIAATAALAAFAANASAATLTVAPGDDVDLAAKIAAAAPGDTLLLGAGQYSPAAATTITKNLTFRGPATAPGTIIAGANINTPDAGGELNIFRIATGTTVTFENIQFQITNASNAEPIDTSGTVSLRYSTISGSGGAGVSVRAGGALTVLNSTIADNLGSGIVAAAGSSVGLESATISGNGQSGTGAGIQGPATVTLAANRSIISSAAGAGTPDCTGGVTVGATGVNNLSSDAPATCGAAAPSSATLLLGPLQGNGGPTDTIRPGAGSSAINAYATGGQADDQRHVARPGGAAFDIGAYEINTVSVAPVANIGPIEATGPTTPVPFTAPAATNPETGAALGTATCTPASPGPFPVGTTPVSCSFTNAGVTATSSFTVQVVDTTAPTLTGATPDVTAASPDGNPVAVAFTAPTATDAVTSPVNVVCRVGASTVVSGSLFPIGTSQVICSATDGAGLTATRSFNVIVSDGSANGSSLTNPSNTDSTVTSNQLVNADRNITTSIAVSRSVDFGRITIGRTYNTHSPVAPFVRVITNAENGYDLYVARTLFLNRNSVPFDTAQSNAAQGGRGPNRGDLGLNLLTELAAPGTPTNPLIASADVLTPASMSQAFTVPTAVPVGTLPGTQCGPAPGPGVPDVNGVTTPCTATSAFTGGAGNLRVGSRPTYTLDDGDVWTTKYSLDAVRFAPSGAYQATVTYTAAVHP